MKVGLVGFTAVGKSTLFELMTGARPDPSKVHSGQLAMATLSDPRLDFLAKLHRPKKITPAAVEILDTPGLLRGTHGDNPQRLALIREADAFLIVLDGFSSGSDPAEALDAFQEELLFADLGVVTNRAERLEASVKKPRPDRDAQLKELETVKKVLKALESSTPISDLDLTAEEKKPMRSFGLLTDKPRVVVVNEIQGNPLPKALVAKAPGAIAIDAKLELELAQLAPDERKAFGEEMGIGELGKDRVIRAAYDAAGIITFFTAGEPEVRGWNVERGGTAVDAAGKIHTDLARGFIRAEVTPFDELFQAGSVREAKARNFPKLEGKDYIVKDGDVMFFRSSV
jgi:GTP-binding protein YchF